MGEPLVVNGASLTCSFGLAPGTLTVLPAGTPIAGSGQGVARVVDMQPMVNIAPFGMCQSLANPQVASATAAAQGVLTPQPCIPVITGPWAPGSAKVTLGGVAALTPSCTCQCAWAGVITITMPGQTTVSG